MKRHLIAAGLTVSTALATAGQAHAEGLTITAENVRNNRGTIIVLVFDEARAFDRLNYLRAADYAEVPARAGDVEVSFPGLRSGPYAVFLFHDENGDQDVNYRNGRLLEGIGATGAPNPDDDPSFAEAAVTPGRASVILHYDK